MNELERKFLDMVGQGLYMIDTDTGVIISAHTGKAMGNKRADGYVGISIARRNMLLAHRLIWIYANGDLPYRRVINHKNGDKRDNRLANLECVTSSENNLHAIYVLGKGFKGFHGTAHPRAKLSNKQVDEIRSLCATGRYTRVQVANMFGVSASTISGIAMRRTWNY